MHTAIFLKELFASTNTPVFVSDTQQPYEDVLSSNSSLCRVTRITQSSHCHLQQNLSTKIYIGCNKMTSLRCEVSDGDRLCLQKLIHLD